MHIGILQAGHSPDTVKAREGDYGPLFETLLADKGLTFTVWSVVDGEFPPNIDAAEGWLITGSRHGVYEDHDWIPPLEDFIRELHAETRPLVGICFGHQIIAQALGGHVEKFDGGWVVGPQDYDFDGTKATIHAWHQDQVITPPEGAKTIASHPHCAHPALVYGDHIFSVQPHPEFTPRIAQDIITHRGPGLVPEEQLREAEDKLGQGDSNAAMADKIATFLKEARHG